MPDENEPEQVVIEHPDPRPPTANQNVVNGAHHGRVVSVNRGLNSFTIPPTIGHDKATTFNRSDDTDKDGLAIFRPAAQ